MVEQQPNSIEDLLTQARTKVAAATVSFVRENPPVPDLTDMRYAMVLDIATRVALRFIATEAVRLDFTMQHLLDALNAEGKQR